jgi:hypothetical protein
MTRVIDKIGRIRRRLKPLFKPEFLADKNRLALRFGYNALHLTGGCYEGLIRNTRA